MIRKVPGETRGAPRRLVLNVLTALSLLLLVATAALWVRSHWHYDAFTYARSRDKVFTVVAMRGRVMVSSVDQSWGATAPSSFLRVTYPLGHGALPKWETFAPPEWRGVLGFLYKEHHYVGAFPPGVFYHYHGLVVPLWFPAAVLAALPARGVVRRARRRWRRWRARPGWCRRCGYDMRATPGRCPECGDHMAVSDEKL